MPMPALSSRSGFVQPGDGGGRAVLDDDLAGVAEDLEPVGADEVVGRGDEHAGRAVAVVDDAR